MENSFFKFFSIYRSFWSFVGTWFLKFLWFTCLVPNSIITYWIFSSFIKLFLLTILGVIQDSFPCKCALSNHKFKIILSRQVAVTYSEYFDIIGKIIHPITFMDRCVLKEIGFIINSGDFVLVFLSWYYILTKSEHVKIREWRKIIKFLNIYKRMKHWCHRNINMQPTVSYYLSYLIQFKILIKH